MFYLGVTHLGHVFLVITHTYVCPGHGTEGTMWPS